MGSKHIADVVGTGTSDKSLIGLLSIFRKELGIDEVTFRKHKPF